MKITSTTTRTTTTVHTIETVIHDGPVRDFKDSFAYRFGAELPDNLEASFAVSMATENLRRVLEDIQTFKCLKRNKNARWALHHCQPSEAKKYKGLFPGIASEQVARLLCGYLGLLFHEELDIAVDNGAQLNVVLDSLSLVVAALEYVHRKQGGADSVLEDALKLAVHCGAIVEMARRVRNSSFMDQG